MKTAQYFEMELETHNLMLMPSGIFLALAFVLPVCLLMILLVYWLRKNKSKTA